MNSSIRTGTHTSLCIHTCVRALIEDYLHMCICMYIIYVHINVWIHSYHSIIFFYTSTHTLLHIRDKPDVCHSYCKSLTTYTCVWSVRNSLSICIDQHKNDKHMLSHTPPPASSSSSSSCLFFLAAASSSSCTSSLRLPPPLPVSSSLQLPPPLPVCSSLQLSPPTSLQPLLPPLPVCSSLQLLMPDPRIITNFKPLIYKYYHVHVSLWSAKLGMYMTFRIPAGD